MSAPLVVNTRDGVCWTRRVVTSGGIALYAPESVKTCPDFVMATEAELAELGIVGSAYALPMPVREEPQALRKPVTDVAAAVGEGTVLLDSGATGFAPDLREALIGLLGTIAESGHRLLPASEDPPNDCRGCGGTGERYDGTGPDGHVWSGESCCCSHEHCSCGACGFPCELADYAVEVARGLVGHRAEAEALRARVAELEAAAKEIQRLHTDSPMGPCPVCIDGDAMVRGDDYTLPYPCPTARLAGAKDCDPPSRRKAPRPPAGPKPTPMTVYLGTPCATCDHTLSWHRNDVGCTVDDCACGRFAEPASMGGDA